MSEIAEHQKAVEEAQLAYARAKDAEDSARRDATNALNRLNSAQQAFDKAINEFKAKASRGSDWLRSGRTAA